MRTFLYIFWAIDGSVLLFCIWMLGRVNRVYSYRKQLLRDVSNAAELDIELNKNWHWRYERFEAVAFNDMVHKFWRPLDSFYPNKDFIEPLGAYDLSRTHLTVIPPKEEQ